MIVWLRGKAASLAAVATVAGLAAAAPTAAPAAKSAPVVKAVIWPNLNITFSPKTLKRGTYVIKVTNRSVQDHKFLIGGVTSAIVGSHATRSVKVTFKKAALYLATLSDCGYLSLCVGGNPDIGPSGYLKVTR
ncbi:MAG TPA: hypothetical protein VFA88_05880 [Gaiellaceae bacterium]|nr:hypothetical protein [Gaiellaceae bacterium]